jgi:peroxiredoxin
MMLGVFVVSCSGDIKSDNLGANTIHGKSVQMQDMGKKLIIVYSQTQETCSQCLKELRTIAERLEASNNTKIPTILLLPYDEENLVSAKFYSQTAKVLLDQDTTFYDKPVDEKDLSKGYKLAELNKVKYTPAVLLVNGDKRKYLSNTELYDKNNYEGNYKAFNDFFNSK